MRLLPDDRTLAAGAQGISLWQARRPGVASLTGYPNSWRTLAFSPDSRWLVAAGLSAQVFLWDARDGRLAGTYTGPSRGLAAVAFSRDGRVASAGGDLAVRM